MLVDVARVRVNPEIRRGIVELNGEGEVADGIIVMRSRKNALETIGAVKAKLAQLKGSLPADVEVVPTYDRAWEADLAECKRSETGLIEAFREGAVLRVR